MSPSLRFLAIAVIGWTGVRAATLDSIPGAQLFAVSESQAKVPPLPSTSFPPIEPVAAPYAVQAMTAGQAGYMAYAPQLIPVPIRVPIPNYYYAQAAQAVPSAASLPSLSPALYAPPALPADWSLSHTGSASLAPLAPVTRVPRQSVPAPSAPRLDRIQMTAWAMLRGRQGELLGPASLAEGGQLGGSQAGARLTYNLSRQLAATLRTSSDVGRRGGEVAAGLRVQPIGSLPLWLTAERRQRISSVGSGRNAFALFAETGFYGQSLPLQFQLDAYLQGGVVGLRSRDLFIDGGATMTRPLFRQFSAGVGIWGGAQPGVYRFDTGPRLSMRVHRSMQVHFDWRQRIMGNAAPGSGPAVTLAGDF